MQVNDGRIWKKSKGHVPDAWPREDGELEMPALLIRTSEGPMAGMTRNMLETYGIPVLECYQGDGTMARVLFGVSAYGVELYVPTSRLEEARNLLDGSPAEESQEAEKEPEDSQQQ